MIAMTVNSDGAGKITGTGDLTVTDLSTEDTLMISGTDAAALDTSLITVKDTNGDVVLGLGSATITLEGIGDGTIDDLEDLIDDRGYHIVFA
jgi:hypothetical protein